MNADISTARKIAIVGGGCVGSTLARYRRRKRPTASASRLEARGHEYRERHRTDERVGDARAEHPVQRMRNEQQTIGSATRAYEAEASRIAFLVGRDGEKATIEWVKRTLAMYRRAVLDRSHFASSPGFRRLYLASCACFRRWLATRT